MLRGIDEVKYDRTPVYLNIRIPAVTERSRQLQSSSSVSVSIEAGMALSRFTILAPVLLVALLASSSLVHGCVPMNDPCSVFYQCCDCDPTTNYELYCDFVYSAFGLRCTTKAFKPKCDALNQNNIMRALNLPRKLNGVPGGFSTPQEILQLPQL
uniref:Uncharacterized protein n=1 Tax=Physcomitrium patens TaxID=3218 RepID=A0A2K1K6H3_PHYPA|nr:hypothetical protein PHYPA_011279 [Physcomitrium patens]